VSIGTDRSREVERSEPRVGWPASLLALLALVVLALVFYHLAPGLFSGGAVQVIIRSG
jgi:hypothetical protein